MYKMIGVQNKLMTVYIQWVVKNGTHFNIPYIIHTIIWTHTHRVTAYIPKKFSCTHMSQNNFIQGQVDMKYYAFASCKSKH